MIQDRTTVHKSPQNTASMQTVQAGYAPSPLTRALNKDYINLILLTEIEEPSDDPTFTYRSI